MDNYKHVRWMVNRDMARVILIEQACFEFPWSEDELRKCLKQRNVIPMVVESSSDEIMGYMVYELFSDKLQLLNIAVDPKQYRVGVGRAMIEKLIGKLYPDRRTKILAAVRETNLNAQLFFKAMGFKAIEVLENYYNVDEDTYMMQYSIKKSFSWENRISKFVDC